MLRTCLFAAAVLVFLAGTNLTAAQKKGATAAGEIVKVDAEKGVVTVKVKVKKEFVEKEFKIDEKTPVVAYNGKEKAELTGKDVLKKDQFKAGSLVSVTTDADGNVTAVSLGKLPPKNVVAAGEIIKVDAEKGVVTLKVKAKKELVEKEFKVDEKTPVVAFEGGQKTDLTGKDVLKKDQFKVGSTVSITTDPEGTVTAVTFGKKGK